MLGRVFDKDDVLKILVEAKGCYFFCVFVTRTRGDNAKIAAVIGEFCDDFKQAWKHADGVFKAGGNVAPAIQRCLRVDSKLLKGILAGYAEGKFKLVSGERFAGFFLDNLGKR